MDNTQVRMTNLFLQLGLDSSAEAIAEFIRTHQLPADVRITEAPFWSESQRQFRQEMLVDHYGPAGIVLQLLLQELSLTFALLERKSATVPAGEAGGRCPLGHSGRPAQRITARGCGKGPMSAP